MIIQDQDIKLDIGLVENGRRIIMKKPLKEMLKKIGGNHLLNENDGHPQILNKNKEVVHN